MQDSNFDTSNGPGLDLAYNGYPRDGLIVPVIEGDHSEKVGYEMACSLLMSCWHLIINRIHTK